MIYYAMNIKNAGIVALVVTRFHKTHAVMFVQEQS